MKSEALKHIQENTCYVGAEYVVSVKLTDTKQIKVVYITDGLKWTGEIQKIYLDKEGEAYGYDVYIY